MTIARALPCLALLTLFGSTQAHAQVSSQDLDRALFNPILASIVKIEAVTEAGGYSLGSAVAVKPGLFVSSCHVTAKAVSISIQYQGLRWAVTGQRANLERDLCLLEAPRLSDVVPVQRGRSSDLRVGDGLAAIGYTFGAGLATQAGTVRALHPVGGGTVIQSATYFNSGASGGGLFTLDGRLVGILTFRLKGAEAYYFSIPVDWIDAELARTDGFQPIAPLAATPPFWAQPPERLPFFMRAATLQARNQWPEVVSLTETWAQAEADNAEPWFIRGQALVKLDQRLAAVDAYEHAVALNPRLAPAWFQLGEAQFQLGKLDAVRRSVKQLEALDPELAADLRLRSSIQP
ncbi:serine protease [Nevskia sp.]|uniref:S1 family peptidase n=1 Tax=Nevskia sp. TaxID=1929292 RepID=UPI0025F79121|nr:tetratricopeptide repeat-containing serine protease family protein [Nevskia sp.]